MQVKLSEKLKKLEALEGLFQAALNSYTEATSLLNEHHSELEWEKKAQLEGIVQKNRETLIDVQRQIDECSGGTIRLSELGVLE